MTRSIITIDEDACKGCGLCVSVCPKGVLAFDTGGFNARGVIPARAANPEACICCAGCALMCPDGAITIEKETE